jgi:hypothetical protein
MGTLRVHVAARRAKAAPEVLVVAEDLYHRATQLRRDEAGYVLEHVALGSYRVAASPSPSAAQAAATLVLDRDGLVAEAELELPASQTLQGTVRDEQGNPVPDAWVRASARLASEYSVEIGSAVLTDAAGAFVFEELQPGTYDLDARSNASRGRLESVEPGSRALNLVLLRYGSISGTVTSAAGAPAPKFDLTYESELGDSGRITGFDGRWSLPGLAAGDYRLRATAQEGTTVQTLDLRPGQEVTLALALRGLVPTTPPADEASARAPANARPER